MGGRGHDGGEPARTEAEEVVTLVVPGDLDKSRADKAVTELLSRSGRSVTRSEVQRWMGELRVRAGELVLARKTLVSAGDVITVAIGRQLLSAALPDPTIELTVVYEDAHLVVIDKPAGLVVHPGRGHREGTLVNALLARGGFEAAGADERDPEGHLRPGIVHRLDKDTSGLLVVAKRPEVREALKELFSRHAIERSYLAIVVGRPRRATYDTGHGRHPKSRLRFTSKVPLDRTGVRRAVTHVEPLRDLGGKATLVRCTLQTGRTHQIRVHLAEQAKTPILGDPLYGKRPEDPALARIGDELGRQALHAAVLGFVHPVTKEAMRWESALPADMQRAIAALTTPST